MEMKISPLTEADLVPYREPLKKVVVRLCVTKIVFGLPYGLSYYVGQLDSRSPSSIDEKTLSAFLKPYGQFKLSSGRSFDVAQLTGAAIFTVGDTAIPKSFKGNGDEPLSVTFKTPKKVHIEGLPEGLLIVRSEKNQEIILSSRGSDLLTVEKMLYATGAV